MDPETHAHLVLLTTRGLGPVLIARALERFGSATGVLEAPAGELQRLPRMPGGVRAEMEKARARADEQAGAIERHGVTVIRRDQRSRYPELLAEIPGAPPLLFVRGELDPRLDRYPVAIVGSRRCSTAGMDQSARFAGHLASAGLTVVSGGARGIDARSHHAAMQSGGRTIAVMGCGLDHVYPPEHRELYERIGEGAGAVVSEFPMGTAPTPELFPRRNRIISGLSLGVLVIEAGRKSGALITAKQAVEEHGRDAMALPGPVDRPECAGSNDLLKSNGAAMVTEPSDVLDLLRERARFLHEGTHAARYAIGEMPGAQRDRHIGAPPDVAADARAAGPAGDGARAGSHQAISGSAGSAPESRATRPPQANDPLAALSETQRRIIRTLGRARSLDELVEESGLPAPQVQRELTVMELRGLVRRDGSRLEARIR